MALSGTGAIAIEWVFVSLAFLFVGLRCYVRFALACGANAADYLVIAAALLLASCCACDTVTNSLGMMRPDITYSTDIATVLSSKADVVKVLKIMYASALPYYTELWLVKAALLVFYYSIIPKNMKKYRMALHIVSGIVVITYLLVLGLNTFACLPIKRNWSLDKGDVCLAAGMPEVFLFSVASNVATDLMIFSLPFPLLPTLRLSKRSQLYGLIFVFGLGFLCIVASVSRCVALARVAAVTDVAAWTAAECCTGIMVACSPALRALVRGQQTSERASRAYGTRGSGKGIEAHGGGWMRANGTNGTSRSQVDQSGIEEIGVPPPMDEAAMIGMRILDVRKLSSTDKYPFEITDEEEGLAIEEGTEHPESPHALS